ncbi:hypothetical protein EDC96DRAFT_590540 [Choanephora cucurbitarum]|nr:hypothetical protein EDC96DRAFT_590540 [Choanephora cucurbitarum]
MPVSVEKDATDEESGESDESDESTDEGQGGPSKSQNDDPSSSSNFKRGRKRHCAQKVNIEHCSCSPLVKQLITNQLMPASYQSPKRALDFALLDYFHLFKMNAYVSNHCFARIWNQSFYGTDALEINDVPLTKLIVNNVYFLYRRLVLFAKDKVNKTYDIEVLETCLGCEDAKRKLVSLDGNFQLKHCEDALPGMAIEEGMLAPSAFQSSLWGPQSEVLAFEGVNAEKEDCILEEIEDSVFKANSNNNRNTSISRYDENGVVSMSCARHGVPERLYNIRGGEGHKYALACVQYLMNTQKEGHNTQYVIMYDIVCMVKKNLEFPYLKENDTWYAVTAFHAYAHNMACQVRYNPKYISNFGYTDGEDCERFWSYLNCFVSMTRSMSSSNRLLVTSDSVSHFTFEKMLELQKIGYFKKIEFTNKKFHQDQSQSKNPKKIEKLRQETTVYEVLEQSSTFIPPINLEDSQFAHLKKLIDSEVTAFLASLLENYLLALAINKKHLFKNGNIGSKKAAKLTLTINNLKKIAKKIIDIYNQHLCDTCS